MRIENSKSKRKTITSALTLVLAVGSVLSLTSCGANGPDAPTRMIRQVTDGVEGVSGDIRAVNVLLVIQPDSSAVLVGTIVNEGQTPDAINAITLNGVPGKLTPIALVQNKPAIFAGPSANQSLVFPATGLKASDRADLEITYAKAAPMKLNVLVREKSDIYANVSK